MGYQMHKGRECSSSGEDIQGTSCLEIDGGVPCRIWSNNQNNLDGLYDIVCTKNAGNLNPNTIKHQ